MYFKCDIKTGLSKSSQKSIFKRLVIEMMCLRTMNDYNN